MVCDVVVKCAVKQTRIIWATSSADVIAVKKINVAETKIGKSFYERMQGQMIQPTDKIKIHESKSKDSKSWQTNNILPKRIFSFADHFQKSLIIKNTMKILLKHFKAVKNSNVIWRFNHLLLGPAWWGPKFLEVIVIYAHHFFAEWVCFFWVVEYEEVQT